MRLVVLLLFEMGEAGLGNDVGVKAVLEEGQARRVGRGGHGRNRTAAVFGRPESR